MKNLFLILGLVCGFSFTVESQETLYLEPYAPDGKIVNGREYIPLSNEKIKLELAYDCKLEEKLLFDLVVFNNTNQTITVSPSSFYYLGLDDPDADSSRFPARMALAPEQPYKWYDRSMEEPQYENTFASFMEIPNAFAEAFFGSAGTRTPPRTYRSELERIDRLKETIREEMMQEMKMAPGEVVNGFVYFPCQKETETLLFCFPIDNLEFQFVYMQKRDH